MFRYLFFSLFFFCGAVNAAGLDDDLKDRVRFRANISAVAEWCELDWGKRSFSPFMDEMRSVGYDDKMMSYIGTYHGVYMQRKANELKSLKRKCGTDDLQKLEQYID